MSTPPSDKPTPQRTEREEYMDVSRVHAAIMREKDEPIDGYEPVPTVWLAFAIVLAMWGGWYLGSFNMGFSATALEGSAIGAVAEGPKDDTPIDPMVLGKRVYNNCMACHQATGTGAAGQFPPLAKSEWVLGDDGTLVRILLHGLGGPVQVLGKSYENAMPAWGKKFSDAQIGAVLTYIRGSWGNDAAAVDASLVAEIRKQTAERKSPWTQATLVAAKKKP